MDYYILTDDFYGIPNQLFITEISGFDNSKAQMNPESIWTSCHEFECYHAAIESGWVEVDFTKTFYGFCVVSHKIKMIIDDNAVQGVGFIPLRFDRNTEQKYYCMIDSLRYDCVDEDRSVFTQFLEGDEIRPDLAGHYKAFFKLVIDTEKIPPNAHIFRIKKSDEEVLVSQKIKSLFEKHRVTGVLFSKVTGL